MIEQVLENAGKKRTLQLAGERFNSMNEKEQPGRGRGRSTLGREGQSSQSQNRYSLLDSCQENPAPCNQRMTALPLPLMAAWRLSILLTSWLTGVGSLQVPFRRSLMNTL